MIDTLRAVTLNEVKGLVVSVVQVFRDRIAIMNKQNIVVTFDAPPEQKALLLEILGSEASLAFLKELSSAQRERALQEANVLLAWNFPREIPPNAYPLLQQISLIQLL